jgi:hypothetical protein
MAAPVWPGRLEPLDQFVGDSRPMRRWPPPSAVADSSPVSNRSPVGQFVRLVHDEQAVVRADEASAMASIAIIA